MVVLRKPLLLAIFASVTTQITSALNIVVISTLQTGSHYHYVNALTELLLERGHIVYELTTRHPATPHPNRTSFVDENGIPRYELNPSELNVYGQTLTIAYYSYWSVKNCKAAIQSLAARDFLAFARDPNRPHIDVVVQDYIHHECLGPFASEFGAPHVVMTAANAIQMDDAMGAPLFPGFVPYDSVIHPIDEPLGWLKRMENKWAYLVSHVVRYWVQYPIMNYYSRQFFGEDTPTIEHVKKEAVIGLVNSHPAVQGSRPLLPSVVQVGGFHVPPIKPLPENIKTFLDSATDGFILISFGSIVPVHRFEPWRREALLAAFKRLRPLRIIMRWEVPWNEAENGPLPDNVLLSSWIPQADVMGHANIRGFVTHCGGLSTNEILSRSVPIIAVPFYADQFINAQRLIDMNIGIKLTYADINEETFYNAVRKLVDDKKYLTAVRKLSSLYHDQPETPQQRAVFWVEFAARQKDQARLRSPGERMSWMTRWMMDDLLIAMTLIAIVLFLSSKMSRNLGVEPTTQVKIKAP